LQSNFSHASQKNHLSSSHKNSGKPQSKVLLVKSQNRFFPGSPGVKAVLYKISAF